MKNERLSVPVAMVMGILFLFALNSCKQTGQQTQSSANSEIPAPEQIISVAQAKTMYQQYSKRRVPLIQKYEDSVSRGERKFDVARYTYYDYKTIKQYLAYIEQEAEKAGVEITTLRFYFSNYPEKDTFDGGKKVMHPGQNSIFLMPTIQSEGQNYGYFIQAGEAGDQAVLLTGHLEPYPPAGMGMVKSTGQQSEAGLFPALFPANKHAVIQGDKSMILNEGNSAPPPYH